MLSLFILLRFFLRRCIIIIMIHIFRLALSDYSAEVMVTVLS